MDTGFMYVWQELVGDDIVQACVVWMTLTWRSYVHGEGRTDDQASYLKDITEPECIIVLCHFLWKDVNKSECWGAGRGQGGLPESGWVRPRLQNIKFSCVLAVCFLKTVCKCKILKTGMRTNCYSQLPSEKGSVFEHHTTNYLPGMCTSVFLVFPARRLLLSVTNKMEMSYELVSICYQVSLTPFTYLLMRQC